MMANEERQRDEVFVARVAQGLRELDGVERAPDVSDEVLRRLTLSEPRAARAPWRWLTAVAALLAIAVTTAVLVQHNNRGGTRDETVEAQGQDPIGPNGAVRLVYEFPADELQRAVAGKVGRDAESLIAEAVACMQRRVGDLAKVTRGEGTTVTVTVDAKRPKEDLRKVESLIAAEVDLQMRIVADDDYRNGDVRFRLGAEKKKLEAWLEQPGNKERLCKNPLYIRRFNEDATNGPEPFGKLAWYPHLVVPAADGKRWDASYADNPMLARATVRVYDDAEYSGGVSEAMMARPENKRYLIELLALNMDERHFTGADLDPVGISVGPGVVKYRIVDALASDYGDWSEKYIGRCCAIVLNGVVKSAPRFESRIPGRGVVHGLSGAEAASLAKLLSLPLVVQPELQSKTTVGPR